MFGLETLDVILGLVFVYLLLSLVCTAVSEIVESVLKRRASDLERGIRELLSDPKNGDDTIVKDLYDHPLVSGLFPGFYDPTKTKKNLPSYIPARNFALAVMDIVLPADKGVASGAADAIASTGNAGPATPASASSSLQPLRTALDSFPNAKVRQALRTLVDAAGNDAEKARENIENWYNSSMDRVSGWYKRRVQMILLVIGLLITVAVNADTITICNSLSHDQALRNALASSAQEYAKTPDPSPQDGASDDPCANAPGSPECRVKNNLDQIRKLGLPVGWDPSNPLTNPPWGWAWLTKIFGWLITAAAITLGAPFWFDVLNKIMVIRSTVKPHEKSREEPSADRK